MNMKPGQIIRRWIVAPIVVIVAISAAAIGLALYLVTAMPGSSYEGALKALTPTEQDLAVRMKQHVAAIASVEHNVDHYQELESAAQYIEKILSGYGYAVKRQTFDSKAGKVRNLEISIPSKNQQQPGHPIVVVGAHYDSAEGATGANDNGSGTAAVIELARLLKDLDGSMEVELILVLYVNEEPPYFKTEQMGSRVHAAEMKARGKNVVAMVSLETMGSYSDKKGSQHYPPPFSSLYPDQGNFIAFVGDTGSRTLIRNFIGSFREHASFPSEGVAAPSVIPGIDWSDHWSYRQEGYPALMLTDTAPNRYMYYHTPEDTIDKIDFDRMARVVKGVEAVIRHFVNNPSALSN
jgi:hypothetical protein